ncbi:Chaperone protein DnaK [Cystobacter fuscus DSM 2262]|uniref:Chaperone protein DnaK n=1 Tax=Cystobacter fuscus (strain ATCC 25194 / DSM 2262 / NBRC 100088 / M29) TaxID=1242864 RepID=S9Q1E1_CYSF2|nr:Hsp70 family protein [Cystobacter fuscus]EPX55084.1 Chaperone protein DnaK [Cystobacter fuscus DSM 2262]
MGIVLGIDLGTTNSCMARVDPATGQARVLLNREGERTTPSVVAFDASGRVTVGSAARRQTALHPRDTIFGAKRLVGRRFADPAVQAMRKLLPYEVAADPAGNAAVRVHGQLKSPSEVLSHVLRYLKDSAENNLGQPVDGAVITVPAYFDEVQRQETKLAGERAGLTVHRLLNEPTAAMLACRMDESRAENIAVFDLGGGTFDISLLHVEGEVVQVLATCGDNQLGGDNIDELLVDALRRIFLKQTGQDLGTHPEALWRLKEAAESTKRVLSEREQTALDLPYLTTTSGGEPLHLSLPSFSRTLLENLSQRELERLRGPCEQAMRDAGLALADIHRVVLVGGMTRMPAVRARAERYLGRPGERSVNPDEAVALGAALEADIVAGDSPAAPQVLLLDVLSRSLGIRTEGGRFSVLIPRNTTIPTRETKVFTTTFDQQTHVDLEVYQGESPLVEGNRYLGELRLTELTPAAAGAVRVAVDFTIDADGILQVTAREPATGRKAQATLRPPTAASP